MINVPTQEEYDAAVRAEKQKEKEEKEEKKRELPDAPPILPAIKIPQQEDKSEASDSRGLLFTGNDLRWQTVSCEW